MPVLWPASKLAIQPVLPGRQPGEQPRRLQGEKPGNHHGMRALAARIAAAEAGAARRSAGPEAQGGVPPSRGSRAAAVGVTRQTGRGLDEKCQDLSSATVAVHP